jgi:dephospho-CoA kinase
MKKLILIVGLPGSGKSTAAEFIKKHFDAEVFHSGDIIREEIKRRGLEYTPQTDAMIAHWFHTQGREKLIAERTWKKIKKSKKKIIVVEGFRSLKTANHLKKLSKMKSIIISINASLKERIKRELKRRRFGEREGIEYLKSREKLEKRHGIMRLLKKADYKINNSKLTKKQMEKTIVNLISKILESDEHALESGRNKRR